MVDEVTGPGVGWKASTVYTGIDKQPGSVESKKHAVGAEKGEGA